MGSGSINSDYREKLLALDTDKAALVEGSSGYYVVVYHGRSLDTTPTRDVRHILVRAETTTDEDGKVVEPTDEAWAAAKEKVESIQAEYENGEHTEDAFAALANKYSDDGDGTTGGLYEKIASTDTYVPEFLDWIFDANNKPGDVGLVQHKAGDSDGNKYWGYHLIFLVGDNEPVWQRTARQSSASAGQDEWISNLKETDYAASLASGADNLGK